MSGRDTKPEAVRPPAEEPFLERWSRRKTLAREGVEPEEEPVPPAEAVDVAEDAPSAESAVPLELPDLETLGEDSDYSAFMTPGVDESLRLKALRKLFRSPKFNVCDGLDDYCGDFTQFEKLGDLVTADMRYHLERLERLAEQALERAGDSGPATDGAPVVSAAPAPNPEESPLEQHDEPDRPA